MARLEISVEGGNSRGGGESVEPKSRAEVGEGGRGKCRKGRGRKHNRMDRLGWPRSDELGALLLKKPIRTQVRARATWAKSDPGTPFERGLAKDSPNGFDHVEARGNRRDQGKVSESPNENKKEGAESRSQ